MATIDSNPNATLVETQRPGELLVVLAAMPPDQVSIALNNLAVVFTPEEIIVACSEVSKSESASTFNRVPLPASPPSMTLTAADFANAHQLAKKHGARAILLLGQVSDSLEPGALRALAQAAMQADSDLVLARYSLPPRSGLFNSAIIFPLTRALFAVPIQFPLAVDLGLSLRMAERLAMTAQRFIAINQSEAILWPVNEAAVAGFAIREVDVGTRDFPHPPEPEINAILNAITGSLFSDIDAKAAFWQRARPFPALRTPLGQPPSADAPAEIAPMVEAFRLAYINLHEIWALVLPPNTLLALKRLSEVDGSAFQMGDTLWARIVYDFLVAYRLRTMNRGHLLGALIPLYLAWVTSHINIIRSGIDSEHHIEAVATAFEVEKPYVVAHWRWPDRFNP